MRLNAAGAKTGSLTNLGKLDYGPALLGIPSGGFLAIWFAPTNVEGTSRLMGRRYGADGLPDMPFVISPVSYKCAETGITNSLFVARAQDGRIVLVSGGAIGTGDESIHAWVLESEGRLLAGPQEIVKFQHYYDQVAGLICLRNGDLVVHWSSYIAEKLAARAVAQRFILA